MKKTSYFGNRFASALRGFRSNRKAKQLAVASTAPAASEFEALESRILLSGIGTGLNKKSVTFLDADGDKVTVKALGKGAKFNIDLGGSTNNADIANIEIAAAGTSVGVVVSPVGSFTAPVQTKQFINPNWSLANLPNIGGGNLSLDALNQVNQKIQTQYYNLTPGYTNIGSITAADGITEVGSIGLTAAIVPVIDLPGVAVGNINLSTGMVAKVDAFMATNGSYLLNYGGWNAGLNNIDLFDINAGSIAGINISGAVGANNDFLGTITTDAGGIGRLSGTNSQFAGQISLGGTDAFLGNVVLGGGWAAGSSISATGDLTFTANNFNGVIDVGGHLNLALQGASNGDFFAGKGISGLRAGTADSVIISNNFTGSLVAKGGDLAGVTVAGGGTLGAGALFEAAGKIGNIWSNAAINQATIIAGTNIDSITLRGVDLAAGTKIFVGGTVGDIDIANGDLDATISAANFTEVSIRGGNLNGTLLASDGIGKVSIVDGSLTGSLIAQGSKAGIGDINVTNLAGGEAIDNGAVIFSAGNINSITAATTGDSAVGNASIQAQGEIKAFNVTAYGAGGDGAIDGLTLIAPSISDLTVTSIAGTAIANSTFISTVGNVGNITATGLTGGFLNSAIISAGSVGKVTGKAIDTGAGIQNLDITAQTGITEVTGTSLKGAGITGGDYISVTGNIGNITGTSTSPANNGNGIANITVKAIAGTVANVTGTAAGSGDGLFNVTVQADKGITAISGSSFTGDGINGGNYKAINGDIGSVSATTSEGTAISGGAFFNSIGGKISSISATPTGVGGIAVNGANFEAASIGNIEFKVTNLDGGLAVNNLTVEATNGDVGTITVTNSSLANGATGLTNSTITATGNIGQVTVSAVGDKASAIDSLNLTADSEGNDTGDVLGVKATSKSGSAIVGGNYTGANVGPITAEVTALNGADAINGLNVDSLVGKIDAITATTASKVPAGAAITGANFNAETDIVSIAATANFGDAINASFFSSFNGDIGSVKATSVEGRAIAGSNFTGENVGKVEATVTGDGGSAITGGFIAAGDGNVSDIVASTASESGGLAITGLNVSASGDIKSITGTSNIGDAIAALIAIADTDGDDAGTLGNITATATEGSALVASTLQGAVVGNIVAKVTAAANGTEDAIRGGSATATFGNIGTITAEVAGDGAEAIQNYTLDAAGDVGAISATTASESGGLAIDGVLIDGANVGAITAKVTDVDGGTAIVSLTIFADGTNADETISNGSIGAITVTSASDSGDGIFNSTLNAGVGVNGQAIGNVEVTLTKSTGYAIDSLTLSALFDPAANGPTKAADQKATIGTIKALGANDGITALTVSAPVSIGAITSEGVDSQDVNLNAPTTDALTFSKLDNAEVVTVTAGASVTSLGAILVEAPGGTPSNSANLTIVGGGAVTTLGNIGVDGNLTLPTLNTVKTAGTVGANTITAAGQLGTGAAGSKIGLVTLGTAGNALTFSFAEMNGKTNATADATLAVNFLDATADITTLAAKAPGSTSGGVTAILVV